MKDKDTKFQAAKNAKYTLTTAILIVRSMETQATRNAVFSEIKDKNLIYRLVDLGYKIAGKLYLQPIILLAYMLKCVGSVGPKTEPTANMVSISSFNNEKHSIDRVSKLIPDIATSNLNFEKKHFFGLMQLKFYYYLCKALPRYWSFLRKLSQLHGFMPACRIASALAFYIRFDEMFQEQDNLKIALIASNYSPECVGMAAAAHKNNIKIIYANHAPVPAKSPYVPPVLADYSIFYGDIIQEIYTKRSRFISKAVTIGQPLETFPMAWAPKIITVGIFLTALTQKEPLEKLIHQIKADSPDTKILIRHHPVSLLETDVSSIIDMFTDIKATRATPLGDDISECDLIYCGNSGVAMNILSAGKPVAYLADLDSLPNDYIGFVESGLVYEASGWETSLYQQLQKFYSREKWAATMRKYDACFGASKEEVLDKAKRKLAEWFNI